MVHAHVLTPSLTQTSAVLYVRQVILFLFNIYLIFILFYFILFFIIIITIFYLFFFFISKQFEIPHIYHSGRTRCPVMVDCRTPNREVLGSILTGVVSLSKTS